MIPQREYFDKSIANSDNTDGYYIIEQGDFVYNPRKSSDAPYGPVSIYKYPESGIVSPLYLCFRALKSINSSFYDYFFKSPSWHRYIYLSGDSGARHDRVSIKDDVFFSMPMYIPSEEEQLKVSSFLSLIEKRIADQQQLVEHLKKYKRGAIEAIFNRTISFASNTGDSWKEFRLGEFARRITRKNGQTTDIPLTISAQYGLIDQREFFSKTVASSDMSGYYLLHKGEFAYNRSTSSEYPFGSIKRLDKYDKGAVSTLYLCFDANEEIMDSDFIMWYFESSRWHNGVREICAEGARNHGLLNVPTAGFFDTVHYLPSNKAEQKRIAAFLSTIDERYTRAFSELEELNNLKKGLYQRLFI